MIPVLSLGAVLVAYLVLRRTAAGRRDSNTIPGL
jgi:hypothetical protein